MVLDYVVQQRKKISFTCTSQKETIKGGGGKNCLGCFWDRIKYVIEKLCCHLRQKDMDSLPEELTDIKICLYQEQLCLVKDDIANPHKQ